MCDVKIYRFIVILICRDFTITLNVELPGCRKTRQQLEPIVANLSDNPINRVDKCQMIIDEYCD